MIFSVFGFLIGTVITILLLMAVVLAIEVAAATLTEDKTETPRDLAARETVAVLIPAHNEEASIANVVDLIREQLRPKDRILVVADNCTDNTADLAGKRGAEVIVRTNTDELGKGYALQHGIRHLSKAPPALLIIIDADCMIGDNTIDTLCDTAARTGLPVQSLNLIEVSDTAPPSQRISGFAFRVKNLVRFKGLKILGFGCPLAGTGMAFPWSVIADTPIASGSIVEDMKLGIELAIRNFPAVFEPRALVTSHFPTETSDQLTQRRRWEHGHVQTMVLEVPRLAFETVRQRRLDLLVMAADLAIPPLSLLSLLSVAMFAVACVLYLLGGSGLLVLLSLAAILLITLSILLAWNAYGRDILDSNDISKIPIYAFKKTSIYLNLFYKIERTWKRSKRNNE